MEKKTTRTPETDRTSGNKTDKKPAAARTQKTPAVKRQPKTVCAKKLPGIYKKQYTETSLEKKFLKKFYIESDRKFVEKLFSASTDKKGRPVMTIDKNAMIPAADLKKYKLLAKQIQQQKGGIKIIPLIAAVIFIAGIGICVTLFKNIIVEKAISSAMQGIFGAKTDIAKVDLQIFNASLEIKGLEQANKNAPMKNLFQIDSIKTNFYLTDLLRGKFHAETLAVEGVALDTDRKKSGELPVKPAKSKEEKQAEAKNSEKRAELMDSAAEKLKVMFEDYNPEKMIANLQNELKSPAVAAQISADVKEKVGKWQTVPQELQTSVSSFSASTDTLIKTDFSKITDAAKLKATLEQINTALTEGKNIKTQIEKTTSGLSADSKAIAAYSSQIQNAIKADNALVESKLSEMKALFSPQGLNEIMNSAVQSVLYDVCGKYYPYVNKGLNAALGAKNSSSKGISEKKTERKKSRKLAKNPTRSRLPGRTIFFRQDTVPALFIENITASGYEYKTDKLLFKGTASNIANDQDITGRNSTINADFKINGNPNNAAVVIDARTQSTSPLLTASYNGSGFPISTDAKVFALNSKSDISARMTADKDGQASLGGTLNMNISEMTGMEFEPEKVCGIYRNALANVKNLTVGFTVKINSDRTMSISIDNPEKIAAQLSAPITKALTGELNTIANDAKSNVTKMLSEKTGVATEQIQQFTNLQNSINSSKSKIDALQKQLDQKKKQVNEQIANSAKSAANDAAGNLIKKLF